MLEITELAPDSIEGMLARHLQESPYSHDELKALRRSFARTGFAKVSNLSLDPLKKMLAEEAMELLERHAQRRDMRFAETGNTSRKLSNVRRNDILAHGGVIPRLYGSPALLSALGHIVGGPVLPCPYDDEQYVITQLHQPGDTHGWHWDDYSYALVWIIECPPVELGGFVQCVPHTRWNKREPRLFEAFIHRPIYSFALEPGDLYLLRADTTLHRVYPLLGAHRRVILNMAYASPRNLEKPVSHETMDALWAS
ncbi:HalD/BesD family halogenase [Cystobacter ferrugineus]|uniref:Fe2OG dioxygenase domain-containing protein n=1 Tax=Cystobacter ferrugineus TaxID=83449 RepID=A0A1L9B3H7_9BACT|nr:hypothetical protein [Cystobacter ferrugineus]OJH36819.1 hypothetical protein BON30_30395 [Cystobacter ferrugineus]